MKTKTNIIYSAFAMFAFACLALAPQARAVCQDGCLTNDNTVLGDDALISFTTGRLNTAVGVRALLSNITGDSNTATGSGALFSNIDGRAHSLAGVADVNGNGNRDYLLFNASTRQSAIWYLSGVTFVSAASGPMIASGYKLEGIADFNGGGKPDCLLFNPSTRRTAIWYLNNNIFIDGAYGPTLS